MNTYSRKEWITSKQSSGGGIMSTYRRILYAVTAAGLITTALVLAYASFQGTPGPKQSQTREKIELRIADDGKSIVDQHGVEIARFVENVHVAPPKGEK